MKQHTYIAIDLKSFYASVECRSAAFDPLDTNHCLSQNESRTDKTICLPSRHPSRATASPDADGI